jgi:hypothetical protein
VLPVAHPAGDAVYGNIDDLARHGLPLGAQRTGPAPISESTFRD